MKDDILGRGIANYFNTDRGDEAHNQDINKAIDLINNPKCDDQRLTDYLLKKPMGKTEANINDIMAQMGEKMNLLAKRELPLQNPFVQASPWLGAANKAEYYAPGNPEMMMPQQPGAVPNTLFQNKAFANAQGPPGRM